MTTLARISLCVLVFHAPDGSALIVKRDAIRAIREVVAPHRAHLTANANSIIYFGGKGFAVRETPTEVQDRMKGCDPPSR